MRWLKYVKEATLPNHNFLPTILIHAVKKLKLQSTDNYLRLVPSEQNKWKNAIESTLIMIF
jgi:hypothetical protein